MRLAVLLCVLGLVSACTDGGRGLSAPAQPSTVPSSAPQCPPLPSVSHVIGVGEEVHDTLTCHGDGRVFELTAPSNGTLVARVSWEPSRDPLYLSLSDRIFQSNEGSIVARLPVVAGQQYRVEVADAAPWDYDDFLLRFVLTTSIE